jgi:hypothetical protein
LTSFSEVSFSLLFPLFLPERHAMMSFSGVPACYLAILLLRGRTFYAAGRPKSSHCLTHAGARSFPDARTGQFPGR